MVNIWKKHSLENQTKGMGMKQADIHREFADKTIDQSQTRSKPCNFEVKQVHYRNVFQTASHIYQTEGLLGFTRGVQPRMMINVPSTALSWGTYEIIKGFLIK